MSNSVQYGNAEIFCLKEEAIEDYTLRELELSWKGQPTRIIYQYHFLAWPDHGVPFDPACVLNFLDQINQKQKKLADLNPVSFYLK